MKVKFTQAEATAERVWRSRMNQLLLQGPVVEFLLKTCIQIQIWNKPSVTERSVIMLEEHVGFKCVRQALAWIRPQWFPSTTRLCPSGGPLHLTWNWFPTLFVAQQVYSKTMLWEKWIWRRSSNWLGQWCCSNSNQRWQLYGLVFGPEVSFYPFSSPGQFNRRWSKKERGWT